MRAKLESLPVANYSTTAKCEDDWLINADRFKAGVWAGEDGKSILISNGLVSRVFRNTPNLATINIVNQMSNESMLRAVSSEGELTLAPWTSENPIFMHLTSTNPEVVKRAVDQCVECGYEMVILSFGSGLNAEDISEKNIARFKELVDYANSRGIELGCYSLLASRWISYEVDIINPKTGKRGGMTFGSSPCLCSDWGYEYFHKIKTFIERTGMTCFEHDGSYPGNVCASTSHTHHKGLNDSQWRQFQKITKLYNWMCEKGVYINVPDYYFLNGSTKVGIGYREVKWSSPIRH